MTVPQATVAIWSTADTACSSDETPQAFCTSAWAARLSSESLRRTLARLALHGADPANDPELASGGDERVAQGCRGQRARPPEQRRAYGQEANRIKEALTKAYDSALERLKERLLEQSLTGAALDVTLPGRPPPRGSAPGRRNRSSACAG